MFVTFAAINLFQSYRVPEFQILPFISSYNSTFNIFSLCHQKKVPASPGNHFKTQRKKKEAPDPIKEGPDDPIAGLEKLTNPKKGKKDRQNVSLRKKDHILLVKMATGR
jgi:hypothetical protein